MKTEETKYRATLSGNQERAGWCMIFRHPLRKNPDKTPVRVRRGLATKDKKEAEERLQEMNQLLSDTSFWNPQAKSRAEAMFCTVVVNAFYDDLHPEAKDTWELRNIIPIPGSSEGYARVRMVGTTGSGKTTFVRQLIGMDPIRHRFPSTSPAKTTICDTEIVLHPGPFEAAVTFFSEAYTRLHIEECAMAVVWADLFGNATFDECAEKLLEHSEQKFRLSYILGNAMPSLEEMLTDGDAADDSNDCDEESEVSKTDRTEMGERINAFVLHILKVGKETAKILENEFEMSLKDVKNDDESAFQDLLEDQLRLNEDFHGIVDEILEAVKDRFSMLDNAELTFHRDWPALWSYKNNDQEEFVRVINRFSSNYALNFGRLLTPLVEGLRVQGPFKPSWYKGGDLKLVLMDGEGFGHTPESSNSISTRISNRFNQADVIALVDNAEQPMQGATQALLRTLASSGQENKLVVAFTHLDQVRGDNLPTMKARKLHVQRSLENVITKLGEVLGGSSENALKRVIRNRAFFFSKIDKPLSENNTLTLSEFQRMVLAIQESIKPKESANIVPIYDLTNIILSIPVAVGMFRDPWRARLGFTSLSKIDSVHWARVKALAKRFAVLGEVEYSGLMPVADLIGALRERLSYVLGDPLRWEPASAPDESKRQVVSAILDEVATQLADLCMTRLFREKTAEWSHAFFNHSGTGSTRGRARDIDSIYDSAAPTPTEKADENTSKFVGAISEIIKTAVDKANGKFQ